MVEALLMMVLDQVLATRVVDDNEYFVVTATSRVSSALLSLKLDRSQSSQAF